MLTLEYDVIRCGGLATMVTALCRAIDLTRFEPVVVLPRSSHRPPWPHVARHALSYCTADVYRDAGCEVWLLSSPLLDGAIYPEPLDYASIKKTDEYGERVAEILAMLDGDLIHLHDAYAYKCLYQARRLGLPTVLSIHRLHEDEPPLAFAEMAAVRLADVVTTVSHAYQQERADFFSIRGDVRAIPNGIDLAFWSPHQLASVPGGRAARRSRLAHELSVPDRPTFAFIGRLDRDQKGVDVLLDAHDADLATAPINLILAGEGDRDLSARIAAAAAVPGGNLRFLDHLLSSEQVRALLAAVDAVLIPSRYEPFGLIQLEAMAMGALPIASRVGGLRDVIIDLARDHQAQDAHTGHGFGRLFDMGDALALAGAVRDVARLVETAPDRIATARAAASERARAHSAERMARRYQELYQELIPYPEHARTRTA
jgi:glycogen synthase